MKIRMLKNVLLEVYKPRLEEVWDKQFNRWDELNVETISWTGKRANILTTEGDILRDVPEEAFQKV